MLDPIAPISPATRPNTGPSADVSAGDFQTFLSMLTTQMQNQNPLEPIEASDFAAQLATFSGVEQQVQTNQLLSQLVSRMGLSELAPWVGQQVLSAAPARFDGEPMRLVPPEMTGATRAELVVTDRNGREVGRYGVDPQASEIVFDVPPGESALQQGEFYSFALQGYRGDTRLPENPVLTYSTVLEARADAGQTFLVLEGGHMIGSGEVVGLRDSGATRLL